MKEKYISYRYLILIVTILTCLFLFSTPSLALIPGDFGSAGGGPPDGVVDFEDLMIFAMAYGSTSADTNWNLLCDIYPDGVIDFEDLMIFALHYGECECILPSAPTLSDPGDTLSSPATYTVSWTAVSGATSYVLQEATSSDFTSGLQEYPVTDTIKSFSHTVSTTTTYYYRVAAVNDCGQGGWSNGEDITVVIVTGPVHNLTKDTYYNTIQEALDDAGDGNIIEVADGTYEESITSPFGKVIILQSANGNPYLAIIQGDSGFPTVKIDGSADGTTIKGFTITHADGMTGNGIYITNNSNININNCTISGNTAYYGGGILNVGTLDITSSTISGNTADYGGGIGDDGTLTITASTISGNSADVRGGGIYNYSTGTLTITSSTISGNTAAGGGGIYNYYNGTLTITSSTTISDNTATDSDNTTTDSGGGIFNVGTLDITSSTISANTAKAGGGIRNDGTLTITGSTISDNTGGFSGGGIDNTIFGETLSIASSDISGNTAYLGGGINNGATLTITSSNIYSNTAGSGGGIYNNGTFDITSSTISGNTAYCNYAFSSGGGIYTTYGLFGGTSTITSSTINSNKATNYGGGISNDATLTIISSDISGNTVTYSGGGIHNDGTLTIEEGSTISDNYATNYGGGIFNFGTSTITSSTISGNDVTGSGGGIYLGGINTIGGNDASDTSNFNMFTDNKKNGIISAAQHICNFGGDYRSSYPYNYYDPNYALRDTGPAGGLIFYVKEGGYSDGWMYLEAAPASTEWTEKRWYGYFDPGILIGGTERWIGTGQSNTTKIVTWLNNYSSQTDLAAQLCDALTEGGYSDWFLPSQDELYLMYTNLKVAGVGGFESDSYWSSSEDSADFACIQGFNTGTQYATYKYSYLRVRAARAF